MSSSDEKYVIGVDYGTLSGRALLVRVSDGAEIATAVFEYPHAVVEDVLPASGVRLASDWALQVPSDYVDILKKTVPEVLKSSGISTQIQEILAQRDFLILAINQRRAKPA
jgi:L-ribulokinase